jgi:hypothetical protein
MVNVFSDRQLKTNKIFFIYFINRSRIQNKWIHTYSIVIWALDTDQRKTKQKHWALDTDQRKTKQKHWALDTDQRQTKQKHWALDTDQGQTKQKHNTEK